MNVVELPKAQHASTAEITNAIDLHASAIRDAATFILEFDGEVDEAMDAAAQRWGTSRCRSSRS